MCQCDLLVKLVQALGPIPIVCISYLSQQQNQTYYAATRGELRIAGSIDGSIVAAVPIEDAPQRGESFGVAVKTSERIAITENSLVGHSFGRVLPSDANGLVRQILSMRLHIHARKMGRLPPEAFDRLNADVAAHLLCCV
jgi:mRNA-degrading endonuclease toxin of MazEF toxin-antitoxin module